jgi:NhaP-type Na+/H+ or K+/H+ antiporter
MAELSPNEKRLLRLMVFATALSFGILAAAVASMKDFVHGNAAFEFSWRTIAAFAVGWLAGWGFWWVVRQLVRRTDKRPE